MKNLRRVVWSRGMFLTPQHFQTLDNFIEDTLQFRFSASNYCNWGVVDLGIDQESLANGLFTLHHCRGVLPDGVAFSIPETDAPPSGRPVAENFAPTQDSLDVFLALPERRVQAKNVTQPAEGQPGGATTRFVAETLEVLDENGYGDQKSVQVGNKNFRLLFGNQNLDGFVTLRIARVVRSEAGLYKLDPAFIAPCLDIGSSEFLMSLLRRQIEILASKSEALAAGRRQRGQRLADFNTSETATFWLLHTVNSALPELEHIWNVRRGHPEALWVALLHLAGSLSTFSTDAKAREMPVYNHDNLGFCFTALDQKIRDFMETVIPSKCISIPLRVVDRSQWNGVITNDEYFKNSSFVLAINAKVGIEEVIGKVPQLVKVSTTDEIQNLVRLALPGITLRHTPSPPPSVPFKMSNQYFLLNQSGRLWDRIVQTRNISLFIPPEIAEAHPELLVIMQ
jgi:type VI secretion system protein ImpJ